MEKSERTTPTAEDTRCALVYREMVEQSGGTYDLGEATMLGDEDGLGEEEWCVFAHDEEALSTFLQNLTDPGALGISDCSEEAAVDVTETEDFHGWGSVVRHSWTTYEGDVQSRLYSVITVPYADAFFEADCD